MVKGGQEFQLMACCLREIAHLNCLFFDEDEESTVSDLICSISFSSRLFANMKAVELLGARFSADLHSIENEDSSVADFS